MWCTSTCIYCWSILDICLNYWSVRTMHNSICCGCINRWREMYHTFLYTFGFRLPGFPVWAIKFNNWRESNLYTWKPAMQSATTVETGNVGILQYHGANHNTIRSKMVSHRGKQFWKCQINTTPRNLTSCQYNIAGCKTR